MGRLHAARRRPSSALARLAEHWRTRDHLYSDGHPLTEEEAEAVRIVRRDEAMQLPDDLRERALALLDDWEPPATAERRPPEIPAALPYRVR